MKKGNRFTTTYVIEKNLKSHFVEWGASILSIGGAILNANKIIGGFYFWSVANILWMIFGVKYKHWGLVLMNLVFLVINIFGISNWSTNPFVIFG